MIGPHRRIHHVAIAATVGALTVGCGNTGAHNNASGAAADVLSRSSDVADTQDASLTTDANAATKDGGGDAVVGGDATPPPACQVGSRWQKGTKVFVEATAQWGLTGVLGTRLSVVDYDRDGWPDILVRDGEGPEEFAANGKRRRWLLRNTGTGFVDITQKSMVFTSRLTAAQGALRGQTLASGDVDNDGDDDILLAREVQKPADPGYDGETTEVLINNGDGTYSLGPDSDVRATGKASMPAGVTFVDFDRDGLLDVWITHNMPSGASSPLQDRLYRGDGKGGFKDVTQSTGLISKPWQALADLDAGIAQSRAWSGTACDLNNDGLPELLASSYGRAPNHLWRATGKPSAAAYKNASVASGYAYDERQDWTTNINAQCYCLDNPTAADCNLSPKPDAQMCKNLKAGFGGTYRWNHTYDRYKFRLGGNSGATVCADINNDGWLDLLTTEIKHWDVGDTSDESEILVNQKSADVRFQRPGNTVTGLTRTPTVSGWNNGDMTAAVFDFDNDGWPDVYIGNSDYPGNRGLLYHQGAPLKFVELATAEFFEQNRSHGVIIADFDRDGDLDMLVGHSRSRCQANTPHDCYPTRQVRLFLNQLGATSNWIQLELEGTKGSNRGAIGARVEVAAELTTGQTVSQTQEIDGGHGHFNTQKDQVLHFGLGAGCSAEVTVHWPDASRTKQTFQVAANRRYRVVQGGDSVVVEKQ